MTIAVVTGSAGLIGAEAATRFHELGYDVQGIDNDMRSVFFGPEASTLPARRRIESALRRYRHHDFDIQDREAVFRLMKGLGSEIGVVIHSASQPSHDWAASNPHVDFGVNALGTLNLLEGVRRFCPQSVFVFLSTNKVYGDAPNRLPFIEMETRWELPQDHPYHSGIPEDLSIDQSTHSLFGVSKASADLLVQEYGRYFGIRTVCFRGGCLTGPHHAGTELHGFLAYLMKCVATGRPYTVYGYSGKQVRDNIHSSELLDAIEAFVADPRIAEVYNIGGGRFSNCSLLEAIELSQDIARQSLNWQYSDASRVGDHIWWLSDNSRFQSHYPAWSINSNVRDILEEIHDVNRENWTSQS